MEDKKEVTMTPAKDVLIGQRNSFQKQLIDNILDLKRHIEIQTEDPKYQRPTQQGRYVGIDEIVDNYRTAAANAKAYVEIIDELLEAESKGTLSEAWENVGKILNPFPPKPKDEPTPPAEPVEPKD